MPKLSFEKLRLAPLLFLLLFLIAAPITSAFAISPSSITKTKSEDFGGYEIETPSDTITLVYGSWVVPTVTCTSGETAYAYYYVGIQGDFGGIYFGCSSGSAVYYPTCEFLGILSRPCTEIASGDKVSAGDKMASTTTMNYATHAATVTLTDTTKSWTYTYSFTDTRSLFDGFWVLEGGPDETGYLLPKFTVFEMSENFATIGGRLAFLASFASISSYVIEWFYELVNSNVLAGTSALSGATSAFSITWLKAS